MKDAEFSLKDFSLTGAAGTLSHPPLPCAWPAFTFAFQPIVDTATGMILSHEALIRGINNESADEVLGQVPPEDAHSFDENARQFAIQLASRLGILCHLSLNFLPRSVDASDASIRSTIETALRCAIPIEKIILEITEYEMIVDQNHFVETIDRYRRMGLKVAIDDFGAGYSGLNLLAGFQPDMVKLDMNIVRGIESRHPRQAIVRAILHACCDLGIDLVAEGVETTKEFAWLHHIGVHLFQGYLFASPQFQNLIELGRLKMETPCAGQ